MRRLYRGAIAILAVILIAFVAQRVLGGKTVEARLVSSESVAVIGSGSDAVPVAADGSALLWLPAPREGSLPRLPLESVPKGGRVEGTALEQVHVLAAAPAGLRPFVEGSYFGESGVDVNLTSGVELRFGNDSQAARKWKAAAAVLADPSVTALDYVDLHAPSRPAIGGSGHTLPPLP
jgi:cell division septal protein FtsQ